MSHKLSDRMYQNLLKNKDKIKGLNPEKEIFCRYRYNDGCCCGVGAMLDDTDLSALRDELDDLTRPSIWLHNGTSVNVINWDNQDMQAACHCLGAFQKAHDKILQQNTEVQNTPEYEHEAVEDTKARCEKRRDEAIADFKAMLDKVIETGTVTGERYV